MANLKESSFWEEGIYQWETSDPVLGGENGIDNVPTRQLANRTKWLKDNKLDKSATADTARKAARADIADKLTYPKKIGGIAFDGSADIDLPGVNKKGNQDTSGNAATASRLQAIKINDGDDLNSYINTGWFYADTNKQAITIKNRPNKVIEAFSVVNEPWGANDIIQKLTVYKGKQTYIRSYYKYTNTWTAWSKFAFIDDISDSAATANRLAKPCYIGGVQFDGSIDIDLPGVNKKGNQDTSGSAATANRLVNPCYIGGIKFDGSTDVHLPVSAGFVATQLYQPGDLVKLDGHWYECYHPDGCKNKDPRDPANRPSGWSDTDETKPYYWIEVGVNSALSLPEIGSPIYLPATNLREGLIKYRGDANLHKNKFWRLAQRYPNLVQGNYIRIADLRGEFLRGWDDQRGVDLNRGINSFQGDAIRNLVGKITLLATSGPIDTIVAANGIFSKSYEYQDGGNHYQLRGDVSGSYVADINCNISNQVPTASENRPRNIAMMVATRF